MGERMAEVHTSPFAKPLLQVLAAIAVPNWVKSAMEAQRMGLEKGPECSGCLKGVGFGLLMTFSACEFYHRLDTMGTVGVQADLERLQASLSHRCSPLSRLVLTQ